MPFDTGRFCRRAISACRFYIQTPVCGTDQDSDSVSSTPLTAATPQATPIPVELPADIFMTLYFRGDALCAAQHT